MTKKRFDDVFGEIQVYENVLPDEYAVVWTREDGFFVILKWADGSFRIAAYVDTAELAKEKSSFDVHLDDDFLVYCVNAEVFTSFEDARKRIPEWEEEINQRIINLARPHFQK